MIEKETTYKLDISSFEVDKYDELIITKEQALELRDALNEALVDTNK